MHSNSEWKRSHTSLKTQFDFEADPEALTVTLAKGIAKAKNCAMEDINPIGNNIPLDALNMLFSSPLVDDGNEDMHVIFTCQDTRITIDREGTVSITPLT